MPKDSTSPELFKNIKFSKFGQRVAEKLGFYPGGAVVVGGQDGRRPAARSRTKGSLRPPGGDDGVRRGTAERMAWSESSGASWKGDGRRTEVGGAPAASGMDEDSVWLHEKFIREHPRARREEGREEDQELEAEVHRVDGNRPNMAADGWISDELFRSSGGAIRGGERGENESRERASKGRARGGQGCLQSAAIKRESFGSKLPWWRARVEDDPLTGGSRLSGFSLFLFSFFCFLLHLLL